MNFIQKFKLVLISIIIVFVQFFLNAQEHEDVMTNDLINSLELVLFPKNSIEESSDTLAIAVINENNYYFIGRRHQPDYKVAEMLLEKIRKQKNINDLDEIIDIQIKYDSIYTSEWTFDYQGIRVPYDYQKSKEFLFFNELEKTIFSLKVDKLSSTNLKYDFVLNSLKNYSSQKNSASHSYNFKNYGAITISKQQTYLLANVDIFSNNIAQTIQKLEIDDNYQDSLHTNVIIRISGKVNNNVIENWLIRNFSKSDKIRFQYSIIEALATKSSEKAIVFLSQILIDESQSVNIKKTIIRSVYMKAKNIKRYDVAKINFLKAAEYIDLNNNLLYADYLKEIIGRF